MFQPPDNRTAQEVQDALSAIYQQQSNGQWWRFMDLCDIRYRNRIDVALCAEYNPETRYITLDDETIFEDWYERIGVPHEVASTNPDWYMPFKKWMMCTARGWYRLIPRPVLPPRIKPEQFGHPIGEKILVNFFTIVRSRIRRNVKYFWWSDLTCQTINNCLNADFIEFMGNERVGTFLRQKHICYALYGDTPVLGEDNYGDALRSFIKAPPVHKSFREYVNSYLQNETETSNLVVENPDWATIQRTLGSMNRQEGIAEYGQLFEDDPQELKGGWKHEDHACRFILCVYEFLEYAALHVESPDWLEQGFLRYAFSNTYSVDREDKYFFGWALLILLQKSWQHNREYPKWNYDEVLAPVLYEDWDGGDRVNFRITELGAVDLNPETEWEITEFPNTCEIQHGREMGAVNARMAAEYENPTYESDTDLWE